MRLVARHDALAGSTHRRRCNGGIAQVDDLRPLPRAGQVVYICRKHVKHTACGEEQCKGLQVLPFGWAYTVCRRPSELLTC